MESQLQTKLEGIVEGQLPLLLQELVNDRFYAAAIRGRQIREENRKDGFEVGLYRQSGTAIYESEKMALLRGKLARSSDTEQLKIDDYRMSRRMLRFGNDPIGEVIFALPIDNFVSKELTTALWFTLGVLVFVLSVIFVIAHISFRRLILLPMGKLTQEIPSIGRFLDGQSNNFSLERQLGSLELNDVATALAQMAEKLKSVLRQQKDSQIRSERAAAIGEISRQVAHDIRSPLTALTMVVDELSGLPEEQRIILRSAAVRIKDIANNLIHQNSDRLAPHGENENKSFEEELSDQLIPVLVEGLISEKRVQFKGRDNLTIYYDAADESYGIFSKVNLNALKRILSNLINNSVESIPAFGRVTVAVREQSASVLITVGDNGRGIPPEILPRLMKKGATFNKVGGSGLGLFHARNLVQRWGGKFTINSRVGVGTEVTIEIPRVSPPDWFVSQITLESDCTVAVVDDDDSIHKVWQQRFKNICQIHRGIRLVHFTSASEVQRWLDAKPGVEPVLYLMDYEFVGSPLTGLDLIEALGIGRRAILVTSRFEESEVIAQCEKLKVGMIPKPLAYRVPVTVIDRLQSSNRLDEMENRAI